MTEKEARVLNHRMHKHIHDDRVLCAKCEAKGYIEAIEKAEEVIKHLKAPYEDSCYQVCVHCGKVGKALTHWEKVK